jgi:hypothetical protein
MDAGGSSITIGTADIRFVSVLLSLSRPVREKKPSGKVQSADRTVYRGHVRLRKAGTMVSSHDGMADCGVAIMAIREKNTRSVVAVDVDVLGVCARRGRVERNWSQPKDARYEEEEEEKMVREKRATIVTLPCKA